MTFLRRSPLGLFVVPGLILMIGCSGGDRSSSGPEAGPAASGPGVGTPDEGPASGGETGPGLAQEASGRAALAYIPEDAFAAIVLHPRRAAATELGKSLLAVNVVKAGIRQSNIRPADVEQIVYAMGVPTDLSENDCTIVRFARPVPREAMLEEEFAGLPYEEVQFRGTTYYRYADEFSTDEGDFLLPDASETLPGAAPVGQSTVLARYPGDLQPKANGHADSSDSGNWFYYSSQQQNPTLSSADLYQLRWNPQRKAYVSPRGRMGNDHPTIGKGLDPSPFAPHYAVLRWESRMSAEIRLRGNFKKFATATGSDGVKVVVFVDGEEKFSEGIKGVDTIGVDFDLSASVRPGSVIDFVVDPSGSAHRDFTYLTATIERRGGTEAAKPDLVETRPNPATDDGEAATLSGTAVYFPDDKTLVSTDEQRLRRLISDPAAQTPLTKKLAQVDLEHDLVAVVALDGYRDQAAGLLELAAGETGWAELAGLAVMPKHAKSAVAALDLAGDRLLHLTLEADEEDSAGELHDGAKYLVGLLPGLRNLLPNEMPGARPNPLLPLFDELVAGITVRRDALKVLVDVQSPDGLAEFVENDAETVVGSMVPPGAGPRPDVSTPGEFDQPEDTPKTVTHRPPPKDHPDFRDLVVQSHNCRIYFPGKPELEEQSVDTPAGKIEISTFMTEYKGLAYAFSILDYPPSLVRKAGAETLLNEYRGGIVDEPNGTLLDSKMSNYQGSPSNDFQYVDPDYGAGALARCRTVLKGNRMFHLKVVGKAPAADVHLFFQSLVMADQAGDGPPADAVAAGEPAAAPTIIEPAKDNWEVGAGNLNPAANELVIDAGGRPYWLISRDALPANFRLQIEGRIEFLQGGQVLQNTQKDILRSLCVRFCTADQKADVLDAKGYHIRHSHTMLLLSKEGKILARGDLGNGPRPVSAIPTGDGLKVTIPDREPWPFTMAITKKDDKIAIECNGAKVVDHTDRFYLTGSNKLAIGGYLSRLYLGRVTVTDLGPPKPPPGGPGGATTLVDSTTERERFQPLLLRHPVDFMGLTEDGRYLVAGHREADSISVVDVRSLDLVKTIDTPAPTALLCRGDQLIVANLGVGSLSVFSQQKEWEQLKAVPVGDPNPEYISAPGGRNYRGVVAVRGRGNGRDALPVILVNVNRGRAILFNNGRTSAATVDYGGNVMVVQSRAGSPNRYIAGVYNFAAVSQGRATPSMGEQLDSFPLLYQVGETPYWFGGRQVFAGMPVKPIVEAEQLLVADRVVNVCYAVAPNRLRCLGLDKTVAPIDSRPIAFPSGIRDATTVGDLHVAATIGERLYFFLLSDDRTIQTVRLPAFEIPENLAKTDRAVTVAKAMADASEADKPVRRTWKDTSGRFEVEAELVELKAGQVTLKKADGSTVTVPVDRLSQADRDYLERRRDADTQESGTPPASR